MLTKIKLNGFGIMAYLDLGRSGSGQPHTLKTCECYAKRNQKRAGCNAELLCLNNDLHLGKFQEIVIV